MRKKKIDTSFDHYLQEELKDPEFKAEFDALEPEFAIISALVDARAIRTDAAGAFRPHGYRAVGYQQI